MLLLNLGSSINVVTREAGLEEGGAEEADGGGAQEQEVLYYEDIQSAEMREEFDRAPLISRTVTRSDWCTVR